MSSILLLMFLLPACYSINKKLLQIEPTRLSEVMKSFMIRIIAENCREKNGFLFGIINEVESEFSDFVAQQLNRNNTVVLINLDQDADVDFQLNPNHFKFALADPEVDLSNSGAIFTKIKISRARVVLIFTKPPIPLVLDYIFNSYYQLKSINIIIAYEDEANGRVEVVTFNPYLPQAHKTQNLTDRQTDFFYDKTRNLHGSKIRCLMTYRDRTKIKRIYKNGVVSYEGKDYSAISTLIHHLNGNLEVLQMDNVLLNPWFESLRLGDQNARKIKFLAKRDISIFIKSEQFTMDDDIIENLYPHTQNDITSVAPKSTQISMSQSMMMLYKPSVWLITLINTLIVVFVWIWIKKSLRSVLDPQRVYFDVIRVLLTSNLSLFPRNTIERFLIFSYILATFIIDTFVQSKITSFLAIKKYNPEIDTIEELFSSGLPLYSIPTYISDIKKKYSGTGLEQYADTLIPLTTNEGLMDQMIYRADVEQMPVFLAEHDIALFVSRFTNFRQKGVQVYHLVKESIIPNFQSYKVTYNSPLLPILNKKLRRLEEGGFIKLWSERAIFNATVEGFLYPENSDEIPTAAPISWDVVRFMFNFLIFGYFISGCVFLCEIIAERHKRKKFVFLN